LSVLPKRCTQSCAGTVAACTSRNLRLRPAPAFVSKSNSGGGSSGSGGSGGSGSITEGLLLAGVAVLLALYVADHQLLGASVVSQLDVLKSMLADASQWGPDAWNYLYTNMSRDQLFFFTLPVLLISEIPLWFFTILDYMKLRCANKYRIHYSKIEKKKPRDYPTHAELWKAFKVHCINFFGLYCSVFLIGVSIACHTNIIPYSFSKTLPTHWWKEFLFCSFFSDVLFYIFHRAVHSKGLYQRLHKMHHEWIYTIGQFRTI